MRLVQTLCHCRRNTVDLDILEVGCGAGFAAEYLSGFYRSYTGIDHSEELIRYATFKHTHSNVTFYAQDFYQFSPPHPYHLIFMIGVLHHMPDIPATVKKCCSLVKPGGMLIVNEPHSANMVLHTFRKIRTKIDRAYSDEQEELTEVELTSLFRQTGLTRVNCLPQGFFSTPFAEVIIQPQILSNFFSRCACSLDAVLERLPYNVLKKISWNIIVQGEKKA